MRSSTVTATFVMPGSVKKISIREWSVEVLSGPDRKRVHETTGSLLRVGADSSNDLVLDDGAVSRNHLEIERTDVGFLVKDLRSRNGSFIEGRRIVQAWALPGEKVALGKTVLTIRKKARDTSVDAFDGSHFVGLDGESTAMRTVFAQLRKLGPSPLSVLIEGETGVGKELAARALHELSGRTEAPFAVIDCSLVTPDNFDREVLGVFAKSDGGTVLLDEVGHLTARAQQLLTRVLEAQTLADGTSFDVRIVATTSSNLKAESERGNFSEALLFRVTGATLSIPPLRSRKEDLAVLAARFLPTTEHSFEITKEFLDVLNSYDWPGNVRELRNVVHRSVVLQSTQGADLFDLLLGTNARSPKRESGGIAALADMSYSEARDVVLSDFEKAYFTEVVRQSAFALEASAKRAGLSTQSLYRLLQKNGIQLKKIKKAATL